ncbi:Gamma-glutamylputrescine oxidoreductase [compost metagenome]
MNARVRIPVHTEQHAPSYYAATANRRIDYPPLAGEVLADVCIVGGGFTGLNTAIELARRGRSVVLLEATCTHSTSPWAKPLRRNPLACACSSTPP